MNTSTESTQKTDPRIVLAALWAAHFLLWSFGDMAALLQQMNDPIENSLLIFVAVPLALIQALMIYLSLTGKAKVMRIVSLVFAVVYALLDIMFLTEAQFGWEYLLGAGYLLFDGLIAWRAWGWSGK